MVSCEHRGGGQPGARAENERGWRGRDIPYWLAQRKESGAMTRSTRFWVTMFLVGFTAGLVGAQEKDVSGTVRVDGSSTVFPITAAAAELFKEAHPKVNVNVGISGTGGGFKKFLEDNAELRTDVQDASRPISASEQERAQKLGVEYIEIPVAYDGIAVVVHPSNSFVDYLTVAELKKMWEPESKVNNWKDVRPGFPDLPIKLYGPGMDSGTFDYFTEVINGKSKACRQDFMPSEDDNVLVKGVEGDKGALGYFGFSYYEANKSKLKLVPIDSGNGKPVTPTSETIRKLTYTPLARPLFVYVNKAALARPEVKAFLEFYLKNAKMVVEHPRVNYIALSDKLYEMARNRLAQGTAGTVYGGPETHSKSLYEMYGVKE
jgi:phosphate transport system substrate-binding protein